MEKSKRIEMLEVRIRGLEVGIIRCDETIQELKRHIKWSHPVQALKIYKSIRMIQRSKDNFLRGLDIRHLEYDKLTKEE